MYFPLKNPNLPENRVTVVAVSERASKKLLNKLDEYEITAIKTITNNLVTDVGYHTDLNLLNYSEGNILIDKSQKEIFVNFLTKGYSLKTISEVKSPYPYDCRLNCVIMGDKLICNPKTVSDEVLLIANELDIKFIPVNQGYTKCSICLLNDNALITDDESIYSACKTNQIDSLLISKGSVKLNGFDYGFIGGCTGLIDKNKLLFNGDINYHKDCNMITDFLDNHNVEAVIINNEPLNDIGSIIPLCEKPD